MKIKIYIATFLILVLTNSVIAHQDFFKVKTIGKVKVRIKTGFNYEEINKAWIIGGLTNQLLQKMNYNDSLFLDFSHHYINDCRPDYFICYDQGEIEYLFNEPIKKAFTSNVLVIRQVSSKFDITATLNLVEYSIMNFDKIVSKQNKIKYIKNYCQWGINTIDTVTTKKISNSESSSSIKEILKGKIFLPREKKQIKTNKISYYYQNEKFFIYANTPDKVLIKLDDIYQFIYIKNQSALVFDTDTSFYLIQNSTPSYLSNRHTISTKRLFPWGIYKAKMYNDSIVITDFEFDGIEPRLLRANNGVYIIKEQTD